VPSRASRAELASRSVEAECVRSWSAIGVGEVVRPRRLLAIERSGLVDARCGDSVRTGDAMRALLGRDTVPGSVACASVTGT
jgi:hypothetical protein